MSTYEQAIRKQHMEEQEIQRKREQMTVCPQCGGRMGGGLIGNVCIGKLLPYAIPGQGRFGKSCGYNGDK